ncbi:hypothetical protein DFH09DRAFT_1044209 [Mycena vulgaris]|nr:hypothetical protein DFH09DRAFT_1044209 [Mycena vulgaris]
MPIITNSSGFQIHGGNFYEVSGDVNLETLTARQEQRLLDADRPPSSLPRRRRRARQDGVPDQRAESLDGEFRDGGPLDCPQGQQPQSFRGGTFISAENVNYRHGEEGIHILHRAVALDALYNSAESFPQPRCHPETQKEMLDSLYQWAIAGTSRRSIRWLHGPAGAGKSAIMQSLCHRLQQAGRLGGSFFFKRAHLTRGSASALFTTLAYQLALSNRRLKPLISGVVEDNPSVMARHMDIQLHKLIVEPCQLLNGSAVPILVIDGLDECEGSNVQQEILCLLGDIATHYHPLPLRLLIASRPEPQIREKLESFKGLYDSVKLDQSFMEVENYLRNELDRIRREHHETMASVPSPWPPMHVIQKLVDTSSGYFIYAATVIKFIDDRDFRPTERLAAVVQKLPTECGTSPFHALDELYLQILRDAPFQSRVIAILCVIVHGSILRLSRVNFEKLLGMEPGDLALALRHLHSLVLVPPNRGKISLHHKSFRDFLLDPNRSGKFHLGLERRKDLARSILRALSQSPALISSTHVAWYIIPALFGVTIMLNDSTGRLAALPWDTSLPQSRPLQIFPP